MKNILPLLSSLLPFLLILIIGLLVAFGAVSLLAWLILGLIAVPSFWGAFWVILVALIMITSAVKAL